MSELSMNRELERDALQSARKMKAAFAWPTLVTLAGLYALGAASLICAANGWIPLWLTCLINSFVAFGGYTPLHEAIHGNLATGSRPGLNRVVGVLSSWLFLHNYSLQRQTHLSHHANLNDPSKDADHWVAGKTWWSVLLRCLTLGFAHVVMGIRLSDSRTIAAGLTENLVPVAATVALGIFAGWEIAVFGVVVPALLGVMLLGLLFDYSVHYPYAHGVAQRYRNTRAILLPRAIHGLATFLWFGQNYHLVHHLYPWVPFYRYGSAFRAVEGVLERNGSPIVRVGH